MNNFKQTLKRARLPSEINPNTLTVYTEKEIKLKLNIPKIKAARLLQGEYGECFAKTILETIAIYHRTGRRPVIPMGKYLIERNITRYINLHKKELRKELRKIG